MNVSLFYCTDYRQSGQLYLNLKKTNLLDKIYFPPTQAEFIIFV